MFCDKCASIEFRLLDEWENVEEFTEDDTNVAFVDKIFFRYYFHYPTLQDLQRSFEDGCHFCAVLWYGFTKPPWYWNVAAVDPSTPTKHRIILSLNDALFHDRVEDSRKFDLDGYMKACYGQREFELKVVASPSEESALICNNLANIPAKGGQCDQDTYTGSSLNMELAKMWYTKCLRYHPQCYKDKPLLPTRIIDLGLQGTEYEPTLYESAPGESARYLALSHCWGDQHPIVASEAPKNGRSPLPPMSQWPKTFRDAVTVTRSFEIRYLWIDGTCINQRDRGEWARESSLMCEYFQNAAFVIAAEDAVDSRQGCFKPRSPLLTRPRQLRLRTEGSESDSRPLEVYFVAHGPPEGHLLTKAQYIAPLYSRAWVLQEQILPRRIIRFGLKQMAWTCLAMDASENDPDSRCERNVEFGLTDDFRLQMHERSLRGGTRRIHPKESRNPCYDQYYHIISSYTRRNMTYQRDCFAAISGLVTWFKSSMGLNDRYLAGLWSEDLVVGLLWITNNKCTGRPRTQIDGQLNYCREGAFAPSWSWASMSHVVIEFPLHEEMVPGGKLNRYDYDLETWGTQTLSAVMHLKHAENIYGDVTWGILRFRAQVGLLNVDVDPSRREADIESGSIGRYPDFSLSTLWRPSSSKWKLTMDSKCFSKYRSPDDVITGDCELDGRDPEIVAPHVVDGRLKCYFLPLLVHGPQGALDTKSRTRWLGLALVPTGEEDEYLRIGRAAVNMEAHEYRDCELPYQDINVV